MKGRSQEGRQSSRSAQHPQMEQLKQFRPLDSLSEKQLVLAMANSEVKQFAEGAVVLELESHDRYEYFLLDGQVELQSFDGRFKRVEAGSESARAAIALLQPRKYQVRALTLCRFVVIQQSVIEALLRELPDLSEVDFNVSSIQSGHEVVDILESFKHDLEHNTIELPSFPDTALEIRRLLNLPTVSGSQIAKALNNDPAITVKLIKACNSPLYKSVNEITSVRDAIVRLGFDTTRQLVNIFALKEVFKSSNKLLRERMRQLWDHAREVAAVSYVLAKRTTGLNPELALLAGLIKDVGVIPVLSYIEDYPQFLSSEEKVDELLTQLKADIGGILLQHWGFQTELVAVAKNCDNWSVESHDSLPSYVDLVVVAEVHTLLGKKSAKPIPHFTDIPAFIKLGEHGLTPELSQSILLESHQQIRELQTLLGGGR